MADIGITGPSRLAIVCHAKARSDDSINSNTATTSRAAVTLGIAIFATPFGCIVVTSNNNNVCNVCFMVYGMIWCMVGEGGVFGFREKRFSPDGKGNDEKRVCDTYLCEYLETVSSCFSWGAGVAIM